MLAGVDGGGDGDDTSSENEGGDNGDVHIIRPHKGGERRKINKAMLREVYHLPINEAAEHLGIGVTVLKKYCRRFEIGRWPFRKLKSIDKLMQSILATSTEAESAVGPPPCFHHHLHHL